MTGWRAYLGTMICAILVAGLGVYVLIGSSSDRVDMRTAGIDWQVDKIVWVTQGSHWRADLRLRAVNITRDAPVERDALLQEVCTALLSSAYLPARSGFGPAAVYRADIQLASVSGAPLMSEHALPVAVQDGQCIRPDGQALLVYGDLLAGWYLDGLEPVSAQSDLSGPDAFRLTFRPIGGDITSLAEFDPLQACEAVLLDGIVAANLAQLAPSQQAPQEDMLDPAITKALGGVVDRVLAVLPGQGWQVMRHIEYAGQESGIPRFYVARLEVVAELDGAITGNEFEIVGTGCHLISDGETDT